MTGADVFDRGGSAVIVARNRRKKAAQPFSRYKKADRSRQGEARFVSIWGLARQNLEAHSALKRGDGRKQRFERTRHPGRLRGDRDGGAAVGRNALVDRQNVRAGTCEDRQHVRQHAGPVFQPGIKRDDMSGRHVRKRLDRVTILIVRAAGYTYYPARFGRGRRPCEGPRLRQDG